MRIELKKFGTILTSRPSGKEAYLVAKAYSLPRQNGGQAKDNKEAIEIDFAGVLVLAPSWADEFLTPLFSEYPGQVSLLPSDNASVKATLELIQKK